MGAIRDAIVDTEDEIFRFANDLPEEEDDPNPTDIELDELGLEEVEGADGLPLSFEEIAHRNLYGDDENNFDRPLQMADEEARHEERMAIERQMLNQMARGQAEQDAARFEQRKQAIIPEVLAQPERMVDHALALERQVESQRATYVNLSLERGHEQYGEDFERYQKLTSLDSDNPTHRSLVQSIYLADDPTAALMNWHEHGIDARGNMSGGHRARPGVRLPSLNSQTAASTRGGSRSSRSSGGFPDSAWEAHGGGFDGDGDEAEIFGAVWR
jgi:hypothetical protein